MSPEQVGARIRAAREAMTMSQTELAAAVGVKRGVIADMEAGRNVGSRSLLDAIRVLELDEAGIIVAAEPRARVELVRAWLSAYDDEATARLVLDSLAQKYLAARGDKRPEPAPQPGATESAGGSRERAQTARGRR